MWQAAIMLQLEQKCRTTALHNLTIKPPKKSENMAISIIQPKHWYSYPLCSMIKALSSNLRLLPFFLQWPPLRRTNAILRVEQG